MEFPLRGPLLLLSHGENVLARAAIYLHAQFFSDTDEPSTVTEAASLPEKSQLSSKLRATLSKCTELPFEKEQKRAWQVPGPRTCS